MALSQLLAGYVYSPDRYVYPIWWYNFLAVKKETSMGRSRTPGVMERKPGTGIWWIRWTDADGRRHMEKVGRRSDAIDLLAKRKHEILLKRKLPEKLRGPVVSLGDLAKDALAHSREANGERSTRELELKLAIIGADFDTRHAEGITKQDIQNWLMEQTEARQWSPATRNRYQAAFSLVFSVAINNGKMQLNPASRIKRKAENNDRIRFLLDAEEKRLLRVLEKRCPRNIPAFLISIHTGMRAGEQFGLHWSQVSLERGIVSLYRTKAGKTRHIPLNSIALNEFRYLWKDSGATDPIFRNRAGESLRGARDWFEPAVAEAKLDGYTWHCNRHTFASRLVMAGVDIRTVAALLGHSTIQMTMRYAHLAPNREQQAVDRLVPGSSQGSGDQIGDRWN
ncbi:MAG TPA: site-specific integrase [Terracidiphilus sp.]|nr:site-specific integrase [Terracidiphilus sp.]